jgi:ribosome-binding factor A
MPRQFFRSDRVSGQLRRELAQLIQLEVKDPSVGFISLSDVEVSRDLAHAKVYITVFEDDKAASTLKALKKAAGFLRRRLGQQLRMRNIPELHFHHDASVEVGQHMDELIASAVAADTEAAEKTGRTEPAQAEASDKPAAPKTGQ